ncbi:hypothetical protein DFH28DRAFT_1220633 [Melampsora americana]|nr:hypothetical protein DFH28DRAFT_1220633 [Melampsora americana]
MTAALISKLVSLAALKSESESASGSTGRKMSENSIVFASDLVRPDKDKDRPLPENQGPVPAGYVPSEDDAAFVFDLSSNPIF